MSIRVGILDQTPIYEGETAVDAFRHTIELAQRAEQLDSIGSGYRSTMIPGMLQVPPRRYSSPTCLRIQSGFGWGLAE